VTKGVGIKLKEKGVGIKLKEKGVGEGNASLFCPLPTHFPQLPKMGTDMPPHPCIVG